MNFIKLYKFRIQSTALQFSDRLTCIQVCIHILFHICIEKYRFSAAMNFLRLTCLITPNITDRIIPNRSMSRLHSFRLIHQFLNKITKFTMDVKLIFMLNCIMVKFSIFEAKAMIGCCRGCSSIFKIKHSSHSVNI